MGAFEAASLADPGPLSGARSACYGDEDFARSFALSERSWPSGATACG